MYKKVFILLLLTFLFIFPTQEVEAKAIALEPTQTMVVEAKPLDPRVIILRDYFAKYNSPLEDSAKDFVEAADQYEVDWKLVPAIAGVESTFGKRIPGGYNGWGWGVYGTQAIYFDSWRDGIFTVTKGLKEDYVSRGLLTPQQMNKRYAASPTWGTKVAYFMNDIDKFAKEHPESKVKVEADLEAPTAYHSASLSSLLALKP